MRLGSAVRAALPPFRNRPEHIPVLPQIVFALYSFNRRAEIEAIRRVGAIGRIVMAGYVAHLDADSFYVNAERVRHPELVGKPVGVLGNNGACVIAKSYEMKACGEKTGVPDLGGEGAVSRGRVREAATSTGTNS